MAWEVWWALVFGFAISAIVQAWVPRERSRRLMSGSGLGRSAGRPGSGRHPPRAPTRRSRSRKSLFQKGASAASALAFQFASTNLVWELGLVLWVLIGWQFTLAEFVGGLMMIVLMALLLRLFVSPPLEEQARGTRRRPIPGTSTTPPASSALACAFDARLRRGRMSPTTSAATGGCSIGRSGSGSCWPGSSACSATRSSSLFLTAHRSADPDDRERAHRPADRGAQFVCSVGNVPLAAVLWSGGISFAGVMAFIFADLIVLPILAIYRKYYGTAFTVRITALMFVTMVLAALVVDGLFSALGLIPPDRVRPARTSSARSSSTTSSR